MEEKPGKKNRDSSSNQYLKYSGLAFQMFVMMAIAGYAGKKLDAKLELGNDYMTLLFVVIVFSGFMYKIIKELT